MKKSLFYKAATVLMLVALTLVLIGVPNVAQAAVTTLTFNPTTPHHVLVGGTFDIIPTAGAALVGSPVYTWTNNNPSLFSISNTSGSPITVTGLAPGTGTIAVKAEDGGDLTGASVTETYTVTVDPMTVSVASSSLAVGGTTTATASNFTGTITGWTSSNTAVATVVSSGAATATVTGVGSGTATITATNAPASGSSQTASTTVTIPTVTVTPASQTLTSGSETTQLFLKVTNGGTAIPTGTAISWTNSAPTIGTLSGATNVDASGNATVYFTSSAAGTNGTATITASVGGILKTATVIVSTVKYLDIVGPSNLNATTRTGTYTVYLKNADGTVYDDDTSTVHWSWSSSYLSMTSDSINDRRADMHDGEAHIQLYARYNTPSSGTRLYAWINSDYDNRVYHTITITGLSSLPQTGQDMTLVYVLSGVGAALLAAAGIWYGIRKKRTAA